ncbi:MAG TPA: GNVR domain-containing protein [Paraburkholderia sp.]|uniref:GNVR domain-containing protein n=1 Tax=Paraburkholderia sp. TaxID=1926495 RepID=UPI002ED411DC
MNHVSSHAYSFGEPLQHAALPAYHLNALYRGRWVILGTALASLVIGLGYATFKQPVYRSDLLIQVEQNAQTQKSVPANLSSMFDEKTEAADEMEVLRSRMVTSQAVSKLKLYIDATPRYVPVVGWWAAAHTTGLSSPLPGGYVFGRENIDVGTFNVPQKLEGKTFKLTLTGEGQYTLEGSGFEFTDGIHLQGQVGKLMTAQTPDGTIELLVNKVTGNSGASFSLKRSSQVETVAWLQKAMVLAQKGKQSYIIGVSLDGTDARHDSRILNEIWQAYLSQNMQRRSADADKSIQFLDAQLPVLKAQLEAAENRFNNFRAEHGTIDTSQVGAALLQQSVAAQLKVLDLQQHRDELVSRFTANYPAVRAVDTQLQDANASLGSVLSRTRALPVIQQSYLRLQRDVQVDTELYTNLLNARQQLTLVSAGKVSDVRLLDAATPTRTPVQPRRTLVIAGSALFGLLLGVGIALFRRRVVGAVEDAREIEASTGLLVYATVPRGRLPIYRRRKALGGPKSAVAVAGAYSSDATIESLRNFRTLLQFSLPEARNHIVLITGATADIGKSFVCAHVAALAGASNKRVLLVDADLRKGALHKYFNLERAGGLADVVRGTHRFEEVVRRDVSPGLDFLSTGGAELNPSEMLLQPELEELLERVSMQYDMVVVDGPPLLLFADAVALGRTAGTVFIVARHAVTTHAEIQESARRLAHAGVPVQGVVFNDLTASPGTYGYGDNDFSSYKYRPEARDA